jgi:RNA polymerase sigma factor (sigma-70 family)
MLLQRTQIDFASLFRQHYPKIYRYVLYRVGDDIVAEDLTSEIFERAYRSLDSYDAERSSMGTWLTHIAHNWVNNYLIREDRHSKHEVMAGDEMEQFASRDATPEAQIIRSEAIQRLLECLDALSERDKQIVSLRFALDTRNRDIAEMLNIKEHTISVVLMRAVQRLRECHAGAEAQ